MFLVIIQSILFFIATNIDDLFMLTILLSQTKNQIEEKEILIGQFIGIFLLVLLSLLGALEFQIFLADYAHFLGFLPLAIGIKELIKNYHSFNKQSSMKEKKIFKEENKKNAKLSYKNIIKVTLLALANGFDNISVYIPLFTAFTSTNAYLSSFIIITMSILWFFLAKKIIAIPFINRQISKYQSLTTSIAYIILGLIILFF